MGYRFKSFDKLEFSDDYIFAAEITSCNFCYRVFIL